MSLLNSRPRALRAPFAFQPRGEGAVGFLAGGVTLEQGEDERRTFGVRDGELGVGVTDVAPGQAPDEVSLACLLLQAAAGPEGQRYGVVLVKHLVDGLGEERGRVGVVVAHRLGDTTRMPSRSRSSCL